MENQNLETATTATEQQEKTFTQEQVNAIIGKRLAEAKASNEQALNKRENELNQREMQLRAKELLAERGLPKELADVMRYENEESLVKAIEVISRINKREKDSNFTIVPNRLPQHTETVEVNPIREAMRLK